MSKKLFFTILCLALLIGWVICLFNFHDETMRNILLVMGGWYLFRFFLRGTRENGLSKVWDIIVSLIEVAGIGFIIGTLSMIAVNIQSAMSSITNLFGSGNTAVYSGASRIYVIIIELVVPALIGLIFGISSRKIKKSKN
jgi:hypothetical protein